MAKEIEVKKQTTSQDNRSLAGWDPFPQFEQMMNRFFGNRLPSLFGGGSLLGTWPELARAPASRVEETDEGYCMTAEIPGIPKEDVEIQVNGNVLSIHAEQKQEEGEKGGNYRRQYRSYHQSFSLPTSVNPDQIEAQYDNGVLEVYIPKTEQAQARKIEVQSGKGSLLDRFRKKGGGDEKTEKEMKH